MESGDIDLRNAYTGGDGCASMTAGGHAASAAAKGRPTARPGYTRCDDAMVDSSPIDCAGKDADNGQW